MSARVVWLFGLPSAGKTTLGLALREHWRTEGKMAVLLDGDELRSGLCKGLSFSDADRMENIRRAAETARLLHDQGCYVVCALITPKEYHREAAKRVLGDRCRWVYVDCPLNVCVRRDVKGLYRLASDQQMMGMTGIQNEFEVPVQVDLRVSTHGSSLEECLTQLLEVTS